MDELTELLFAEATEGQPVEVLRVGTFRDRHGKEVTIEDGDLDAYVTAFEAGEAGQDVPIDVNHAKTEAGGWVRRLWRDGEKLLAEVDWNDLGKRLVGDKVYRYVSASIDLPRKVIRSVSLVNFPAVKGLKAVELSDGLYRLDVAPGLLDRVIGAVTALFESAEAEQEGVQSQDDLEDSENDLGESDMTDQELAELKDQIRAELRSELDTQLQEKDAIRAELREELQTEIEAELAERQAKRQQYAEFAEEVCNGDVWSLSTPPAKVIEFMEQLPEGCIELAQAIIRDKLVPRGEVGSARESDRKKKLEPFYANELKDWLAKETGDLAEFFTKVAPELGEMSDYDLTEFEGGN